MQLTGEQLIGYQVIRGKGRELLAINPDDQQAISTPVFTCATADLVDQACVLAEQAFDPFRATDPRLVLSSLKPSLTGSLSWAQP